MMQSLGPCVDHATALHYFIILANVFQAVAVAYIGARTYRKNREENGHSSYRRR